MLSGLSDISRRRKSFSASISGKKSKINGLGKQKITLSESAIQALINSYSREAGLRNLERMSDKIARKIALQDCK